MNIQKALDKSTVSIRYNRTVTQNFQRLRKIWVFERKIVQIFTRLHYLGNFCNFWGVFCPILFAEKFPTKLLVAPNNWLDKSKI